jgi:hypothetical protein
MPVRIEGDASPDSEITQDGQPVGTLKSARGGSGLANLRLTVLQNPSALLAGTASLTIARPDWMRLPSG